MMLLMLAPAAIAQDLDCTPGQPFQFQEDAQDVFNQDPSDPNGLDGNDNDGLACESLPSRGTTTPPPAVEEQPEAETKTEVVTKTEVKAEEQPKEEAKEEAKTEAKAGGTEAKAEEKKAKTEAKKEEKKEEKKEMPKTGGPGNASLLALGAGALLVGGGLLVRRMR